MLENPIFMVFLLLVLLFFSAFFSGSETALMSISKLRLKRMSEIAPAKAKHVQHILKNTERLIGTVLLGNNLVNISMSALATAFAISIWGQKSIAYVTIILTLVILIFAEVVPKVYAKYFDVRVSLISAPVLKVMMTLFSPVVVAITYISSKILLIIGVDVKKIKSPLFTEAEIKTCITMAWDDGTITPRERSILSRAFTLNDKAVEEIMIPKERMSVIQIDAPMEEIVKTIVKTGYSRFPVSRGEDFDIVGSIHAKDIFEFINGKKPLSIDTILRPVYFIPLYRKIDVQLRSFQKKRFHQAIVRDNEAKVIGLITLEDILEELVGTIQDEHDLD